MPRIYLSTCWFIRSSTRSFFSVGQCNPSQYPIPVAVTSRTRPPSARKSGYFSLLVPSVNLPGNVPFRNRPGVLLLLLLHLYLWLYCVLITISDLGIHPCNMPHRSRDMECDICFLVGTQFGMVLDRRKLTAVRSVPRDIASKYLILQTCK